MGCGPSNCCGGGGSAESDPARDTPGVDSPVVSSSDQAGTGSDAIPGDTNELLRQAHDSSSLEELCRTFLPFVPRRVARRLPQAGSRRNASFYRTVQAAARPGSQGGSQRNAPRRSATSRGVASIASQPPTSEVVRMHAALLLIDVSGFTKLSQLYGERGSSGCESFSLLVSELFRRITVRRPPPTPADHRKVGIASYQGGSEAHLHVPTP